MATTDRLKYRPNLDRDPKKVLDASIARIAEVIAEETIKNESLNTELRQLSETPEYINPEEIKTTKDFLIAVSELAQDYLNVKDRSDNLLDNLSQFEYDLPDDLIKQAALIKYAKTNVNIDNIKAQFPDVAKVKPEFVNCLVNIMLYASDEYYKIAPDVYKNPEDLHKYSKKFFPKFGTLFLIKLFVLFIKGFLWTLFSDLCKQFYKFRIKIGPFKVRPLRPLCTLLRAWVRVLNKGSDVSINPDKPDSDVSYGYTSNSIPQPTKWGVCPHSFYLGVLDQEANLIDEYRKLDDGTEIQGDPISVCAGGNPSPEEKQAAIDIAKYIVNSGIREGDKDHSLAYDYLAEKTRNQSVGQTVENELKKMVEYEPADANVTREKHDRAAMEDIAKLKDKINNSPDISSAVDSFGNSIGADEFTKGVLSVTASLLKVWDGTVTALKDIYTTDRLNKDLICCFITALSLVMTSSMSEKQLLDFKAGMAQTKYAVLALLKFLRTVLDTETDWLASDAEISYLNGNQLLGSIQDAMIKTLIIFLNPVVQEASDVVNKYINPSAMEAKLQKALNEAVKQDQDDLKKVYKLKQYMTIVQKCVPFRYMLGMANCLFAKLKNWLMKWLIGMKSQNDQAATNFVVQIQYSSKAKAFFMLRTVLERMSLSIEQGFEQIWTMCDPYGEVSTAGDKIVEDILKEASVKFTAQEQKEIVGGLKDKVGDEKYWKDIGLPVYPSTRRVGIVENDLCDTIYEEQEWPVPSYSSMPDYNEIKTTEPNFDATIASDEISSLYKEQIKQDQEIKIDEYTQRARDCRETSFITSVFNELREYHNATKNTK